MPRAYIPLMDALISIVFGRALTLDEEGHLAAIQAMSAIDLERKRPLKVWLSKSGDKDLERLDLEHASRAIEDEWLRLRQRVDAGTIKARGRFTATYSAEEAQLADVVPLTGEILAAFSQLDVATGGIRRQLLGSPDVLWPDDSSMFEREFEGFAGDPRAREGFLLVEVEAAHLFTNASIASAGRAPAVKKGVPPPEEMILAKADEMKARGMLSHDIAKDMRKEPGFANAGTVEVRKLIKGRWKPTGRPPKKDA